MKPDNRWWSSYSATNTLDDVMRYMKCHLFCTGQRQRSIQVYKVVVSTYAHGLKKMQVSGLRQSFFRGPDLR